MDQTDLFLSLPNEFVLPDYAGGSIANVPGTVANMLDAPFLLAPWGAHRNDHSDHREDLCSYIGVLTEPVFA